MIDYQTFCRIKALEKEGLTPLQITGELQLDPRTVYYWLGQEKFHPRKASPHAGKLDPFRGDICRMLEKYPYSAAQIFQRLQEMGFDGRYTIRSTSEKSDPAAHQPSSSWPLPPPLT